MGAFVDYYNNQCCHESLNSVTPADIYFGCSKAILSKRKKIKKKTILASALVLRISQPGNGQRRLQHQKSQRLI